MGVQRVSGNENNTGLGMCNRRRMHSGQSLSHDDLTKMVLELLLSPLGQLHSWTQGAVSAAICRRDFKLSLFLNDTSRLNKQQGVLTIG